MGGASARYDINTSKNTLVVISNNDAMRNSPSMKVPPLFLNKNFGFEFLQIKKKLL